MSRFSRFAVPAAVAVVVVGALAAALTMTGQAAPADAVRDAAPQPVSVVPGMAPVVDAQNLYSEIAGGKLSSATAGALERVYVPNRAENTVTVIDPATLKVIDKFKVGVNPQHVG